MKVGEVVTKTYRRAWRECVKCERPAKYRISYLLPNARSNPASSGYGGNDISWCSDHEEFACERHKHRMESSVSGYEWCSTFPLKRFKHMGFYLKKLE